MSERGGALPEQPLPKEFLDMPLAGMSAPKIGAKLDQ